MPNEPRPLVALSEEQSISRSVMVWVNRFPALPETISIVSFEQLPPGSTGMAVSVVPGTYITRRYITGGYQAEYTFNVFFRVLPGASNDARLTADEVLNAIGDWAVSNPPDLGAAIRVKQVSVVERGALLVPYEDGSEDHSTTIKITYEVI